mmetsp:Transcript_6210/g.15807  ORF Transcript_6210/g.15807 Transcript_6210/m.15807 type:complete len:434 (-) Transcript_6210:209-1510(-)
MAPSFDKSHLLPSSPSAVTARSLFSSPTWFTKLATAFFNVEASAAAHKRAMTTATFFRACREPRTGSSSLATRAASGNALNNASKPRAPPPPFNAMASKTSARPSSGAPCKSGDAAKVNAAGSTSFSHAVFAFLSSEQLVIAAAMLLVAKWARCKSESLAKVDAFVRVDATSPAFSFDFGGRVRNKAPRASKVACCKGRAWCSRKDESVPRPPFSRTIEAVEDVRGEFAITARARNAEQRVASRSSCSTKSETAPLSNSASMTSAKRAVTSPTHSMARSLISKSTAPATNLGRAASSNFDATSMPSPSTMSASKGLTNSATATHSRNPSSINLYHSALTASMALGTASSTMHRASSPRARALRNNFAPSNFRDCDFSARPLPEASATKRTSSSPKAPGGADTHNSRNRPKQADFVFKLSPTLPEMGFLHARQA